VGGAIPCIEQIDEKRVIIDWVIGPEIDIVSAVRRNRAGVHRVDGGRREEDSVWETFLY
jgi:hypothetical protein